MVMCAKCLEGFVLPFSTPVWAFIILITCFPYMGQMLVHVTLCCVVPILCFSGACAHSGMDIYGACTPCPFLRKLGGEYFDYIMHDLLLYLLNKMYFSDNICRLCLCL